MLMRRIPDSLDEHFLFDITAVLAWPLSSSTPSLSLKQLRRGFTDPPHRFLSGKTPPCLRSEWHIFIYWGPALIHFLLLMVLPQSPLLASNLGWRKFLQDRPLMDHYFSLTPDFGLFSWQTLGSAVTHLLSDKWAESLLLSLINNSTYTAV